MTSNINVLLVVFIYAIVFKESQSCLQKIPKNRFFNDVIDIEQNFDATEVKNAELDDLPNAEYIKEFITAKAGSFHDGCHNVFVETSNFKLYRFPNDNLKMVFDAKFDEVCDSDGFLKNKTFDCTNFQIFQNMSCKPTDICRITLQGEKLQCGLSMLKPWQHGKIIKFEKM